MENTGRETCLEKKNEGLLDLMAKISAKYQNGQSTQAVKPKFSANSRGVKSIEVVRRHARCHHLGNTCQREEMP